MIALIILLFFLAATCAGISIVYWSIKNGISPMPTSPKVAALLLSALPDKFEGKIYELGAGWGTLAFPLAKKYPDCPIEAIESSPIPYLFCKLRLLISPRSNLKLHRQDFLEHSLKDASMVVCYLYPDAMRLLKDKFEKELAPGTLVVSNTFGIPGWTPVKTIDTGDMYHTPLYFYSVQFRASEADRK